MSQQLAERTYETKEEIKKDFHVQRTLEALQVWDKRRGDDVKDVSMPKQNIYQEASRLTALFTAINDLELKRGFDIARAKVLDVGAGWGDGLRPFLFGGFKADQLYGIDLFADRVAHATAHYPGIHFAVGDGTAMTAHADSSFDIACEQFCFCHVMVDEAREKMASEMLRVVKPGGYIMVMDWIVGSKKRHYNGVSAAKIRSLFAVGTRTDIVDIYPVKLYPPIGRILSSRAPYLYRFVLGLFPFLVGSKLTVLRRL